MRFQKIPYQIIYGSCIIGINESGRAQTHTRLMQYNKKLRLQTSFNQIAHRNTKKMYVCVCGVPTTIFMIIYFFTSTGQLEIYLDA